MLTLSNCTIFHQWQNFNLETHISFFSFLSAMSLEMCQCHLPSAETVWNIPEWWTSAALHLGSFEHSQCSDTSPGPHPTKGWTASTKLKMPLMSNLYFSYCLDKISSELHSILSLLVAIPLPFLFSYKYQKCILDQRFSWPALVLFPMSALCSQKPLRTYLQLKIHLFTPFSKKNIHTMENWCMSQLWGIRKNL